MRSDRRSRSASWSRHGEALRFRWGTQKMTALWCATFVPLSQLWEPPGINEACNVSYGSSSLWNTMTAPFIGMVSLRHLQHLVNTSRLCSCCATESLLQRFSGMVWYQGKCCTCNHWWVRRTA